MAAKKTVNRVGTAPTKNPTQTGPAEQTIINESPTILNNTNMPMGSPTAIVKETPIDKYAGMTPSQKANAIVNEYTLLSTEGQRMFTREEEIYKALSLSPEAATKFLGGKDPNLYFKGGLIHNYLVKELGDVLPDDRDEVISLRKIIKNPDVIMFKHQRYNKYTILIPKIFSENEIDQDNEFIGKIHQDYRVVAFTGQQNIPSAFEEKYFEGKCADILRLLKVAADKRGLTIF